MSMSTGMQLCKLYIGLLYNISGLMEGRGNAYKFRRSCHTSFCSTRRTSDEAMATIFPR